MNNGIVAGTLVHTDKGLVPIEQLKVGDLVLSKHESNTGEQAYKRVISTFKSATRQPIMGIQFKSQVLEEIIGELDHNRQLQRYDYYINDPDREGSSFKQEKYDPVAKKVTEFFEQRYQCSFDQEEVAYRERGSYDMYLFCTDNHPFWVEGQGWTATEKLNEEDVFQGYDGDQLTIEFFDSKFKAPLYQTSIAGVAAYCNYYYNEYDEPVANTEKNKFIDFRFGKPVFILPALNYGDFSKSRFKNDKIEDLLRPHRAFFHPLENFYERFDDPEYPINISIDNQRLVDFSDIILPTDFEFSDGEIGYSHYLYDDSGLHTSVPRFEDYVYTIEVEDFHTYYVGYAGVLVKSHQHICTHLD